MTCPRLPRPRRDNVLADHHHDLVESGNKPSVTQIFSEAVKKILFSR